MRIIASAILVVGMTSICMFGCDKLMGGGDEAAQIAPVVMPPAQPAAAPGQPATVPAAAAVPGQPVAAVVPVQPVAATVPVQPVAAPAPVTPPTPTGDALTDKLNTKKFEVAPDLVATSALLKQELKKGASQSYQVQLPGPPYCHAYVAVAGEKVKNIDVAIESPLGAKEAVDSTEEGVATILSHCPQVAGAYKLTVAMPKDSGEFAVQVFSK